VDQEVVIEFSDSVREWLTPSASSISLHHQTSRQRHGLGLSASYGVVDHHGHISCRNKPDGGALFTLRFPAAAEAAAAVEAGR
jgi:K+-sensing histidine kinase KdpD